MKQLELISENEGKLKGSDLSFREFLLKHRTIIGISKRQYHVRKRKGNPTTTREFKRIKTR